VTAPITSGITLMTRSGSTLISEYLTEPVHQLIVMTSSILMIVRSEETGVEIVGSQGKTEIVLGIDNFIQLPTIGHIVSYL